LNSDILVRKEGAVSELLIVDDEADVREFAANFFRKRKIDVVTAASGEEALEKVNKAKPRLVLLDIKMSGIDGVETLRRIKQIDTAIAVVMVTGKKPEEQGSFEECRQMGAADYIHKPLELEQLERVVMAALAR
jgi:CheY-like chemotaxis protein